MNKWTKILLCAGLMLGSLAIIGHQPVAQTPEAGAAAQGKTDLATDRVKSVNSDAKRSRKLSLRRPRPSQMVVHTTRCG